MNQLRYPVREKATISTLFRLWAALIFVHIIWCIYSAKYYTHHLSIVDEGSETSKNNFDEAPTSHTSAIKQLPDDKLHAITEEYKRCLDDTMLLTPHCMDIHARPLARAFPQRPIDTWCIPTDVRGDNSQDANGRWQGMLLVKVYKAYSSTSAGVVLRIFDHNKCAIQWDHRRGINFNNRTMQSFLFAPIREPSARAISHVNFFRFIPKIRMNQLPQNRIIPNEEDYIKGLTKVAGNVLGNMRLQHGRGGYQFNYLTQVEIDDHLIWHPGKPHNVIDPQGVHTRVKNLLASFDFFIVVERMDESLTALALLTNIPYGTVLLSAAKQSGQYQLKRTRRHTAKECHFQNKWKTPPGIRTFLTSPKWLAMNYADEILYRAANRSLDLTIEHIGVRRFEEELGRMRSLLEKTREYCKDRIGSGCTANGTRIEPVERCYEGDLGCGYECMDEVVAMWNQSLV